MLPTTEGSDFPAQRTPFGAVVVDATRCSACGLCARFCPTGALQFEQGDDRFQLSFHVAACIDCGICDIVCPEDAVQRGAFISLDAIVYDAVTSLTAGVLAACTGCGAATGLVDDASEARCHVCRQGAGVVMPLRDDAGLMADLLKHLPPPIPSDCP